MKRVITVLLGLAFAQPAFATAVPHGSSTHRSTSRHSKKSSSGYHKSLSSTGKTVHVRSYTTKRGKHVRAYDRRPRGTAH